MDEDFLMSPFDGRLGGGIQRAQNRLSSLKSEFFNHSSPLFRKLDRAMAKKKAETKTTKKTATKKATSKTTAKKTTKAASKKKTAEKEPKKKAAKKKASTKKRSSSRAKSAENIRLKVYWGVFNHAMKRVALYDFNQRKAAEKKRDELNESGKPPHFVMKIKEPIEEK